MKEVKHNHLASSSDVEAHEIVAKIKKRARKTDELPANIIAKSISKASTSAAGKLLNRTALSRTVERVREVANPMPLNPTSSNFDIPPQFSVTHQNEQSLFRDISSKKRILIFCTERNLNALSNAEEWSAYGTFSVVPPHFCQLFTLHATYHSKVIPLVYAILPNKRKSTYVNLLRELKNSRDDFSPASLIIDFEIGFVNAFKMVFPHTVIRGCLFHFWQSVYRKAQSVGLQVLYGENENCERHIKMLCALVFVKLIMLLELTKN